MKRTGQVRAWHVGEREGEDKFLLVEVFTLFSTGEQREKQHFGNLKTVSRHASKSKQLR